ncbi:hypothetical protein QQS21_009036 [Conoideocrella luteorostrata]|uniref:Uncharacterized protein n=1 Tax=Conoideocrella luteorostrata TaxID=1105319 RepID=A0AAJ0CM49_9HYPO|nr:hypothetical protein QQS21_009036 [Conoideocrella luteorostrata]
MAATATPIPIRHHSSSNFFELPLKKRKQRRLIEEEQRQRALLEAEEESRSQAWNYIFEFLQASEWSDQMAQITVVYDAVPTMNELESFGNLDEKEGTRACRKVFKAPVVWDELGHGLWRVLRAVAEQKQPPAVEENASKPVSWNNSFGSPAEISHSTNSPRCSSSRRGSHESCCTTASRESVSPRMSLSSSPSRHGSIPKIFSRITATARRS